MATDDERTGARRPPPTSAPTPPVGEMARDTSPAAAPSPAEPPPLISGRVHEACGSGRHAFAFVQAAGSSGAVLWIFDAARRERLCAQGIAAFIDPARLVIARPTGAIAALQVMEEALRSGAAPLVVAELDAAPDLTQSRRLQLAAGTGGGRGLCLVPEGRLATNAAETRWRCRPLAAPSSMGASKPARPLQLWEIVKNKRGPLGAWEVTLGSGMTVAERHLPGTDHRTAERPMAGGPGRSGRSGGHALGA